MNRWMDWSLTSRKGRWLGPELVIPMVFQAVAFSLLGWVGSR